ncbi:MAG: ABC transporter ATP-binding protein [Roseburia sp.]
MSNPKLVYEGNEVSFSYGKNEILHHMNFSIPEGKITTLIGANGCGKSTLFQLLARNHKPDSGEILLEGKEISELKLKELAKKVAIVHQYHTAPPDLTVEKLVEYGRLPHQRFGKWSDKEADQEKINWALEVTQTIKYRNRPVSSLSGGQKQRVWIAMALAQDTKLLLLDEPTTYLDIRYQLKILQLIRKLNREYGITIVMILHDMNQAFYYSDEILAMKEGHIIAQGSPDKIIKEELLEQVYDISLPIHQVEGKKFVFAV